MILHPLEFLFNLNNRKTILNIHSEQSVLELISFLPHQLQDIFLFSFVQTSPKSQCSWIEYFFFSYQIFKKNTHVASGLGCSRALFLATNIFLKFTYKILNSVYIKGGLDKFPLSKTTLNALKIKLKNKSKESLQEF